MAIDLDGVVATLLGYFKLSGNEVVAEDGVRWVRNPACAEIWDANHGTTVRAATAEAVDALLRRADEVYAGYSHRAYDFDPGTPAAFEARLLLDGYAGETEVQLLLTGDLRADPRVAIRPVDGPADWASLARWPGRARGDGGQGGPGPRGRRRPRPPWSPPAAPPSGSSSPPPRARTVPSSPGGPGSTGWAWARSRTSSPLPNTAARASPPPSSPTPWCRARDRGARPVLIGAVPADTPKAMYAAMGFAPVCAIRSYTRTGR